ncbi:MAG: 3-hydroxyacyl-CoA dehydrogenase family protein [Actinomycetota bacterium]
MTPIDPQQVHAIGVIGAGTMGAGIAQVFLAAGCTVALHDASAAQAETAADRIGMGLERWEAKGQIASATEARERLRLTPCMVEFASCDWIIEAVSEDPEAKAEVFRTLGRLCTDHTVLASNTSSLSITWLGSQSGAPERTIGMHFFNPPPVMRLVEIVPGLNTNPEVVTATQALAARVGKTPVLSRDRPGFIANRILAPMINEAIWVLEQGIGSAEDIDQVMRLGMNHPMGPLELADLIGLDVVLAILEVLYSELGDVKYKPCPLLRKHVEAGWLGRKSGRGFYTYDATQ